MAKSGPSIQKREKEKARVQVRLDKEARKAERRANASSVVTADGEDPDIAGIIPGPQPLPVEYHGGRTFNDE